MDSGLSKLSLARVAATCVSFPTQSLFRSFTSSEGILKAPHHLLPGVEGMRPSVLQKLLVTRDKPCNPCLLSSLKKQGIRMISFDESEYPERLRQISDPPPVLFPILHKEVLFGYPFRRQQLAF